LATPQHAGEFQALADHRFAAGFHHTGADEVAGLPKGLIAHAGLIAVEVADLFFSQGAARSAGGQVGFGLGDDLRELVFEESLAPLAEAFLCQGRAFALEGLTQEHQMLTGVVVIQNANRLGEIDPGQFPDPAGAIAQENHGFGPGDAAAQGFGAQAGSKLGGGDDGGEVSRRIIIALSGGAGRVGPVCGG